MKQTVIFGLIILALTGCNSSQPVTNTNTTIVTTSPNNQNNQNNLVVSSHSTEKTTSPVATNSANSTTSTGSPMAKAIDVGEMTAKIEKAEKEFKAKPKDEKAKLVLATAYFERATALTGASQYRAALGDYRKGLKLNPNDQEAKGMHDEIIKIFKDLGREPPKEGEETPPMPIK
jgi:tetratricopeptide (TPR) repeat protein